MVSCASRQSGKGRSRGTLYRLPCLGLPARQPAQMLANRSSTELWFITNSREKALTVTYPALQYGQLTGCSRSVGLQILLIDDHTLFRRGLRLMLGDLAGESDISEAASCVEALAQADRPFDLILLDINMPGCTGLDGLSSVKAAFIHAFIVVMSGEEDARTIRAAIDLGASGFIPKTSSPEVMIRALQLVLGKGIYLPPQVLVGTTITDIASAQTTIQTNTSLPSGVLAGMTQRQIEVLKLALKGSPNKIIARQLDISEGTVKSHLSTVFRLLNVRNRTEALYRVAQFGTPIG